MHATTNSKIIIFYTVFSNYDEFFEVGVGTLVSNKGYPSRIDGYTPVIPETNPNSTILNRIWYNLVEFKVTLLI